MRGRFQLTLSACCAATLALSGGGRDHVLLPVVQQSLGLARKCVNNGDLDAALAHAYVITPDHRIRIRIDCSGIPRAQQGPYRNALSGALSLWESALGEQAFEITETRQPDVVIHFQTGVRDRGSEVSGHVQWTRGVLMPTTNPTPVFTADAQIRTVKPNGEAMDFAQMRACSAHELGHVLGLDDSSSVGDVMGPMDFNHPVQSIRQDEVDVLIRAREEAVQIRRNIAYRTQRSQKV
jgi:hypothetical protein